MTQVRYVNTANGTSGNGTTNETDSSADSAYKTLHEALLGLSGTFSEPWIIYCEGSAADTTAVIQTDWNGFTTTATNFLRIIGQQSPDHPTSTPTGVYDTNLYRIEVTNSNGIYPNAPAHVRFEGLQIKITRTSGSGYIAIKGSNASQTATDINMQTKYCIVKQVGASGNGTIGFENRPSDASGGGVARVWNCLAIDFDTGFSSDWANTYAYNCTAAGCVYGYVADAAWTAINCLATGATIGFVGSFHANSNYNAEDDGNGAPGAASRSGTTFTFVNAAGDNFALASTDAGALDYGSGATPKTYFTDDIKGNARPGTDLDWDIGAFEYTAGGGASAKHPTRSHPRGINIGAFRGMGGKK